MAPIDSVSLERTVCYGACPAYVVTVHADGRVDWEGRNFVEVLGRARGRAGPDAVARLFRMFETPFFAGAVGRQERGEDECREMATDHPSAILTVRCGGERLRYHHDHGCRGFRGELHLYKLEKAVDRAAETGRWIGSDDARGAF